jgi:YVTN family beta-propeller protein
MRKHAISVSGSSRLLLVSSPRLLITAFAVCGLVASAQSFAQNAYVTNIGSNDVSVIDTTTNTVIASIPTDSPLGVAVTRDGSRVYVANHHSNTASAINTANNSVIATFPVGNDPWAVAVTPDGSKVYVTNDQDNTVSVINTSTNTVTTIPVGVLPQGAVSTPRTQKVTFIADPEFTV